MLTTAATKDGIAPSIGAANFDISPSVLTFEWEECPLCVYRRINQGIKRPSTPVPSIFRSIDTMQKSYFHGKRSEIASSDLPPGVFQYFDNWVQSTPLSVPGRAETITLRGKIDTCLALDDGTNCMLDFKTSLPKESSVALYSRQLHAYAISAERAASGKLMLERVSSLGLIAFVPVAFQANVKTSKIQRAAVLGGGLNWVEIERDDDAFFDFLGKVVGVLASPTPPPSGPNCPYCAYIDVIRRAGL